MDRSVIEEAKPQYIRFTNADDLWTYLEKQVAKDVQSGTITAEIGQLRLQTQQEELAYKAEMLGQLCTMTRMIYDTTTKVTNPKWFWYASGPFGEKLKGIAWEDIIHVTGDANSDPWAYGHEVQGIKIGDSPVGWSHDFILAMDGNFKFRCEPLPEEMGENA